jgi:hypothetical protein
VCDHEGLERERETERETVCDHAVWKECAITQDQRECVRSHRFKRSYAFAQVLKEYARSRRFLESACDNAGSERVCAITQIRKECDHAGSYIVCDHAGRNSVKEKGTRKEARRIRIIFSRSRSRARFLDLTSIISLAILSYDLVWPLNIWESFILFPRIFYIQLVPDHVTARSARTINGFQQSHQENAVRQLITFVNEVFWDVGVKFLWNPL